MRFYFRFLYPHQDLIELENYRMLKDFIVRDYESFSGKSLERYFTAKLTEEGDLSKIGSWWDKKSGNEIDIITINDLKKSCRIYEVKRQSAKISFDKVENKAQFFMQNLNGYSHEVLGLAMEDM